jgi:uncharacterized protein (TIGR01777 family)
MRVVITGGTGFIGQVLTGVLLSKGYEVVLVSRNPAKAGSGDGVDAVSWDPQGAGSLGAAVDGAYGVVNLAGENIAGLWTRKKRRRIESSRVRAGETVARAVEAAGKRPAVLVQASAVGFYGTGGDQAAPLDEDAPAGEGFLAEVCLKWEASSAQVESLGVRRAVIRSAAVLGRKQGLLAAMLPAFRLGLGAVPGSGEQGMPWIHAVDEARAIVHLLENETAVGPFNLVSPQPSTAGEFASALGRTLGRPVRLRIPSFVFRLLPDDQGSQMFLSGQHVVPARLSTQGFTFRHPDLDRALADLLAPADSE